MSLFIANQFKWLVNEVTLSETVKEAKNKTLRKMVRKERGQDVIGLKFQGQIRRVFLNQKLAWIIKPFQ